MPVKDIQSKLAQSVALAAVISSDTDTDGAIIDTANYELGLMFALDVTAYTDGDYELQLFESDDSGMSGATQVQAPKILPTSLSGNSITVDAAVAEGGDLQTIGCYSTKRYIRPRIVSTNTTSGATLRVIATQEAEVQAV